MELSRHTDPDFLDALHDERESDARTIAALRARNEKLERVVRYYAESQRWAEPLGMDGCCHLCGRLRADDAYGEHDDHTDDCAWWSVVYPMFAALSESAEGGRE